MDASEADVDPSSFRAFVDQVLRENSDGPSGTNLGNLFKKALKPKDE